MALQKELTMSLPVPLDQEQKNEMGKNMSEMELEIHSLESTKKAIAEQYNDKIKGKGAELYAIAKQYKEGVCYKDIECRVEFNMPEKGMKTIIRTDTNETAKVYDMSEQEVQELEEPSFFEEGSEPDYSLLFGFNPEEFCIEDHYFLAKDFDVANQFLSMTVNSISKEKFDEYWGCLFVHMDTERNATVPQRHAFEIEADEHNVTSWYIYREIPQVTEKVDPDYVIPENVEKTEAEPEF
jgi:hypothetical protein